MLTTERKYLSCILALNSVEEQKEYLSELGLKHFSEPACFELFKAICQAIVSNNSKDYIDQLFDQLQRDDIKEISALLKECYLNWVPDVVAIEKLPELIDELKINSLRRMLKAS